MALYYNYNSLSTALLFRNLASPFWWSHPATHCAPLRMDLLGFTKKRQSMTEAQNKTQQFEDFSTFVNLPKLKRFKWLGSVCLNWSPIWNLSKTLNLPSCLSSNYLSKPEFSSLRFLRKLITSRYSALSIVVHNTPLSLLAI